MKRPREIATDSFLQNPNLSIIPPFFRRAIERIGVTSVSTILHQPISNYGFQGYSPSQIDEQKQKKFFEKKSSDISILYLKNEMPKSKIIESIDDLELSGDPQSGNDLLPIDQGEDFFSGKPPNKDQQQEFIFDDEDCKIEIKTWDKFSYFLENYPIIRFGKLENLELVDFKFDFDNLLKIDRNFNLKYDESQSPELLSFDDKALKTKTLSKNIEKTPNTLLFSYFLIITIIELMLKASKGCDENSQNSFSSNLNIALCMRKNSQSKNHPISNEIYDCIKDEFSKILKKFQQFDKKKFNIHNFSEFIPSIQDDLKTDDLLKSYCHDCLKSFKVIIDKVDSLKEELRKPKLPLSAGKRRKVLLFDKIDYLKELCECGIEQYQKLIDQDLIPKTSNESPEYLKYLVSEMPDIPSPELTKSSSTNLQKKSSVNLQL